MFRSFSRKVVSLSQRRHAVMSRRHMGGGGDMPVPQSAKAVLWQGHPAKEGWESTVQWWYGSSLIVLIAILGFAPETDIQVWAKQEAKARIEQKEDAGLEPASKQTTTFGKHYQEDM